MSKITDYFDISLKSNIDRNARYEADMAWGVFRDKGFENTSPQDLPGEIFKAAYYLGFRAALLDVLGRELEAEQ